MPSDFRANKIEIVIKISKYCNLRCSYCYEFPYLGDRATMSLANLRRLFENLCIFVKPEFPELAEGEDHFSFIWHGGEPFMQPLSYYDQIGALQQALIPKSIRFHNSVQTNLTILSEPHIRHLAERRFFADLGFSFDVYGDQRCDVAGRQTTAKVLRNLEKLRQNEIETAAIAVLSRSTFPHITNIFRFFESIDMSFRILPYHIQTVEGQTAANGLTPTEISNAMCEVFDLWLFTESEIFVSPLDLYLSSAVYYLNSVKDIFYEQFLDESVFIVETNGEVYGYESYGGPISYGNLFDQTFEQILKSENRRILADRADRRMEQYCSGCKYFGACSGHPVAVANPLEEKWLAESGCYVARIISHIADRLVENGLGSSGLVARPARTPNTMTAGHT